mgnify:CR=1 FL=1
MSAEAENIHPLINDKLFQYLLKEIKQHYLCLIGDDEELLTDPVGLETGQIYQYDNINRWLTSENRNSCPNSGVQLNAYSTRGSSPSRISGVLVYNVTCIKNTLLEKIKIITDMLEEYVFDYDIRTLESNLETDCYSIIRLIKGYKEKEEDWEGAAIFGDNGCMEQQMKKLYNDGPNQDKQKALRWAEILARHYNNTDAKYHLARAYSDGDCGYPEDIKKATEIYEDLAQDGEKACMYKAGINYEEGGANLQIDHEKAHDWFKTGYCSGHFGCSVKFANCCHNGIGCGVDKQTAGGIYTAFSNMMMEKMENRTERLKKPVREACYNYGMMLVNGDQVEQDWENGMKYIKYAEKNGCEKAKKKLERMLRAWREDEEESNGGSEQENDDEEEASDEEDASDQEENADY